MKKSFFIVIIFAVAYSTGLIADSPFNRCRPTVRNYISQSYMATRNAYQQCAAVQALWHDIVYEKKCSFRGAGQVIGMYAESTALEKSSYYFMPYCTDHVLVSGDDFKYELSTRDVRAEWLDLPSDFQGQLRLHPHQKQAIAFLHYNQNVDRFLSINFLSDYWVEVFAPIVYVENDLQLEQSLYYHSKTTETNCAPQDLCQAFCNPDWWYYKNCGKQKTTQLAEVRLRLGKSYIAKNGFELIYFSGFSIPTSKGQDPRFAFSPVAGFNNHWGMEVGFHAQILLNRDDCPYAFSLFVGLESLFLVDNKQYRTFDLIGKPWSRYLLFNRRGGAPDQNIPGVNVMTRKVKVHPYTVVDFDVGWRMKTDHYECEIGWGIWGHGNEKIEFTRCCYDDRFGCKSCCMFAGCAQCTPGGQSACNACHKTLCACTESEFGIAGKGPIDPLANPQQAASACRSTISFQAANDPVFMGIKDSDYDLYSAAARSAINQKIHVNVGRFFGCCLAYYAGAGFFVDMPQKNSALQLWGVWCKGGASF